MNHQESEGIKDFSPTVFTEGILGVLGGLGLMLMWDDCVGQAIVPGLTHYCIDAPPDHIEYKVRGIDLSDGGAPLCIRTCEAGEQMCFSDICDGHEVTVFDVVNQIDGMFNA